MDIVDIPSLPGEGLEFEDVTSLFATASQEMDAEKMYFMEGFTLMDAMSAFEIGEPRLDTGYIGEHPPKPFDPLAPLLPAEVCWILDRALAYEMEWHSGNMLAHTVFTLTYIYHLTDLDTDSMFPVSLSEDDPERPVELVTTVLGSCVQGLLKCVDLTWRQMHNNDLLQDSEDWQSDKCEVPVMEGVPTQYVIGRLEMAAHWVVNFPKIQDAWRQPLLARILLRKTLLEIFNTSVCKQHVEYQRLLTRARQYLEYLRSEPAIVISDDSPAQLAFDPYISRRLSTSVPVRVITLPTSQETWECLSLFLDGLQEMKHLVLCHHLATWEVTGKLRLWLKDAPRPAYVRSLTQTSFYGGVLVLDQFTFAWALDQFFAEATGHSWSSIVVVVQKVWTKPTPPPITQIERRLYKLMIQNIKSIWMNPPRHRRYLMNAAVEWHAVYDLCVGIADALQSEGLEDHVACKLPQIILNFRLEAIREIMLSGFQLELYAPEERSHAYWYTVQVIEAQLECYENLLPYMQMDSKPFKETIYRSQVLLALRALSTAMFVVTIPLVSLNWDQTLPSFIRRYKWAYRPDYSRTRTEPVVHPDLHEFMRSIHAENRSPQEHVEFAEKTISGLLTTQDLGGWAGQWAPERNRFLQGLLGVCGELSTLPSPLDESNSFDPRRRLKWDPTNGHPWFPVILPAA